MCLAHFTDLLILKNAQRDLRTEYGAAILKNGQAELRILLIILVPALSCFEANLNDVNADVGLLLSLIHISWMMKIQLWSILKYILRSNIDIDNDCNNESDT